MPRLILFNKPYQVLTQFTDTSNRKTLADYIDLKHVYAAGRLDYDSEGLLVLTDSGRLQQYITHPRYKLPKTYWAQVEGEPSAMARRELAQGVELKDGMTQKADVELIDEPELWKRYPPIRERKSIPTHWLKITIKEGRNRQVRRMTAAVGLPTLRLVRARIGDWDLKDLQSGEYRVEEVDEPAIPTKRHKRTRPKNSRSGFHPR